MLPRSPPDRQVGREGAAVPRGWSDQWGRDMDWLQPRDGAGAGRAGSEWGTLGSPRMGGQEWGPSSSRSVPLLSIPLGWRTHRSSGSRPLGSQRDLCLPPVHV